VLDINLPPTIQAVFEFLKPFSGLLTEFFHLDCLGNFDFYTKWIFRVFVMPALLFGLALLRYSYVRHRGDETATKNAIGGLKSDGFFVLFLVYRASMTSLPQSNLLTANCAHTSWYHFRCRLRSLLDMQLASATRSSASSTVVSSTRTTESYAWIIASTAMAQSTTTTGPLPR
jgi:hypothetical protein